MCFRRIGHVHFVELSSDDVNLFFFHFTRVNSEQSCTLSCHSTVKLSFRYLQFSQNISSLLVPRYFCTRVEVVQWKKTVPPSELGWHFSCGDVVTHADLCRLTWVASTAGAERIQTSMGSAIYRPTTWVASTAASDSFSTMALYKSIYLHVVKCCCPHWQSQSIGRSNPSVCSSVQKRTISKCSNLV